MMLGAPGYREQARRFADKYADFDQDAQRQDIMDRIEEIAGKAVTARKQAGA